MCLRGIPGVHHVELDMESWPYLFGPPPIQFELGPNSHSHMWYPMDLWTELKSLTFHGLHSKWLKHDQLVAWLATCPSTSIKSTAIVKGYCHGQVVRCIDRHSVLLYEHLKENVFCSWIIFR